MKEEDGGLLVLCLLMVIVAVGIWTGYVGGGESKIVETRREHLVFEDEGCRIFQVRIKDKDGLRFIYVAVPHPDKHGRFTTPYARCQVTAH